METFNPVYAINNRAALSAHLLFFLGLKTPTPKYSFAVPMDSVAIIGKSRLKNSNPNPEIEI
jgi:hypothetical protein